MTIEANTPEGDNVEQIHVGQDPDFTIPVIGRPFHLAVQSVMPGSDGKVRAILCEPPADGREAFAVVGHDGQPVIVEITGHVTVTNKQPG